MIFALGCPSKIHHNFLEKKMDVNIFLRGGVFSSFLFFEGRAPMSLMTVLKKSQIKFLDMQILLLSHHCTLRLSYSRKDLIRLALMTF